MSAPLTVIARLRAKSGQEARLRQELQGLMAPTRAEAGCIGYDLHESQTDPALFVFHENWKSQADLDAHFETPHIKAILKIAPEMMEGEMDLTKWTKLK
jgi:quinol monooxygenase YgiN